MRNVAALAAVLPLLVVTAFGQATVQSPDGALQLSFSADDGVLAYAVTFHGRQVMLKSALGLDIQDQPLLGPAVRIVGTHAGSVDETYSMPSGKNNPVRNVCKTLTLDLEETRGPGRKFTLEARAYDDGVAFRYLVPEQPELPAIEGRRLRLAGEKTEFGFAKDGTGYPLILANFRTPYEDSYSTLPLSSIHQDSLVALPLLAELPGVAWVAVTEADIDDYAGMYLRRDAGGDNANFHARLSPTVDQPGVAVRFAPPFRTPWRAIMVAAEPGKLIESNIVTNLNPPSRIADTSWIKPGKTAWDWWSGTYAEGVDFKPGMNTATMNHYIDFASENGLEYMLIDAGWSLPGTVRGESDITRPIPEIDMPAILGHAKAKNVRVWLWLHWNDVTRLVDEAFPLYEKWGVAGVKIDYMNRDDQWMANFYRRTAEKAAGHHLMVDYHGAFKPDGMERTWPNVITREGVMGAEYNKWSGRVTPDHNVMLAFTRMLAGPMDYTPGGFHNVTREEFVPQNTKPMVMGTRAHALGLYVVFESGLQMVADYPEVYQGQKELDFIRAVPAVWDETRVAGGRPGEYVTVARRHGREWYVGSITGWHGREIDIPLEFLGKGDFIADIFSDAPDADRSPTHTVREEKRVTAATLLHVKMASGGGQAIRIRPAR